MPTESVLIFIGALVLFSYVFDLVAARARVPSVLLLLALGLGLRALADRVGPLPFDPKPLLPTLGTLGLILIVLDGALELKYTREKRGAIIRAFLIASIGLLLTGAAFTLLLYHFTDSPLQACMANAVPFSVISSAVAIPSALGLSSENREFIIYESSLSDILGVIVFNIVATDTAFGVSSLRNGAVNLVLVLVISLFSCLLLYFLMARSKHQVRSFLILALLMMIYGISKYFHLSSLVIILAFGLFIANLDLISWPWLKRLADYPNSEQDRSTLQTLTMESTFIVRTFFFVLFGFTISISELWEPNIWMVTGAGLLVIYIIRAILLRSLHSLNRALLVLAPRGLITVLLFLSLPKHLYIAFVDQQMVVAAVLGTALVMAFVLPGHQRASE